ERITCQVQGSGGNRGGEFGIGGQRAERGEGNDVVGNVVRDFSRHHRAIRPGQREGRGGKRRRIHWLVESSIDRSVRCNIGCVAGRAGGTDCRSDGVGSVSSGEGPDKVRGRRITR